MVQRRKFDSHDSDINLPPSEDIPAPSGSKGSSGLIGGFPDDYAPMVPFDDPAGIEFGEERWGPLRGMRPTPPQSGTRPIQFSRETGVGYFDGDEWLPGNLPAASIWEIQQLLVKGGFLTGEYRAQMWDEATAKAYKKALTEANSRGVSVDIILQEAALAGEEGRIMGGDGGSLPPEPIAPETLRRVFRKAVIEELGEGWDANRIEGLVQAYNSQLTSGSPGVQMPTPDDFIANKIQEQDPTGVQSNEMLGFATDFIQNIGNTAWGQ